MMRFEIRVEQQSASTLLYLSGTLNMQTSPKLIQTLKPLLSASTHHIVVDMQHIEKIDSAGIATLIEGLRWGQHSTHQFTLQSLPSEAESLLKMYKLHHVFEVKHG